MQEDRQHDSDCEDDAGDVDVDDLVKNYAREWVNGLDRDDLMALCILLYYLLVYLLKVKMTDASKMIADLTGKCESTVREWRATFIENRGSFPDTLQGRYQRSGVLWQNEESSKLATR